MAEIAANADWWTTTVSIGMHIHTQTQTMQFTLGL